MASRRSWRRFGRRCRRGSNTWRLTSSTRAAPERVLTAAEIDASYAVNTRASLLLVQAFAARHDARRPGGRVILLTSGQHRGPMPAEIPYAASKGALGQITAILADALADRGITVNAVNPGPVDTGYATGETYEWVRRRFPAGRWGEPDDPARLIAWLCSDEAAGSPARSSTRKAAFAARSRLAGAPLV